MGKKTRTDKRQTEKDTGIATVDAKMSTGEIKQFRIAEETRDALNKLSQKTPEKGFDFDNATAKELEDIQFSGFRLNKLSNELELWALGRILSRRNAQLATSNPGIIAQMHEEAFHTVGSIVTVDPVEPATKPPFNKKEIH